MNTPGSDAVFAGSVPERPGRVPRRARGRVLQELLDQGRVLVGAAERDGATRRGREEKAEQGEAREPGHLSSIHRRRRVSRPSPLRLRAASRGQMGQC